jgi:molecular chaperone DnaJ
VRDPYEVLGIGRNATEADVKSAFRRLAVQHHPDKNPHDPQAPARFKEINQAYQILSDPQNRAAYDRFGAAAFRPGGSGGRAGVDFVDLGGLDGIFGDILGAFGIRTGDRGDLRQRLKISFEEAARGCEKEVHYEKNDVCAICRGTGAEPGTHVPICPACNGRGRVRFQQGIFPIAVERACSRCRGTGKTPNTPCHGCRGAGLVKTPSSLKVQIPAGIESGSSRLVERAGNRVRPDRAPGDLELVVEVTPHPLFRRVGDDVVCRVPITFAQAALGGELEVPTLDGKVKLRIPPSTQPGTILRIRGRGLPHRLRTGSGDQLVEVSLEVPTSISERAQALIEQLGKELGEDVQPQQKTFVEKLRSLFE